MTTTFKKCSGCQLVIRGFIQSMRVENELVCEDCYTERKLLYRRLSGGGNDSVTRNRLLYYNCEGSYSKQSNVTDTGIDTTITSRHARVIEQPKRKLNNLKKDTALTRRLINTHQEDVVLTTDGVKPKKKEKHWKPNTLSDNAGGSLAAISPQVSVIKDEILTPSNSSNSTENVSYYRRWKQIRDRDALQPVLFTGLEINNSSQPSHKIIPSIDPPLNSSGIQRSVTFNNSKLVEPLSEDNTFVDSDNQITDVSHQQQGLKVDGCSGKEYVLRILLQTHNIYQSFKQELSVECQTSGVKFELIGTQEVNCPELRFQLEMSRLQLSNHNDDRGSHSLCQRLYLGTHERFHKDIFLSGLKSLHSEKIIVSRLITLAATFSNSEDQSIENWRSQNGPSSQSSLKVIVLQVLNPPLEDINGLILLDEDTVLYPEYVIHINEM